MALPIQANQRVDDIMEDGDRDVILWQSFVYFFSGMPLILHIHMLTFFPFQIKFVSFQLIDNYER